MSKVKFWILNARPASLPQSMMPALVAAFLATKYSDFKWYLALISMIGVAFAHLSLNLFDDLFNYRNPQQGSALQDGTVTPKQWLIVSCLFGLIACCFGVPVLILRGIRIFYIILGVAILGFFYYVPPLKLGSRGLGEIIIGLILGPALGIGMSIAASGEFHASEVMVSCSLGLLLTDSFFVHSIMDFAADKKAGKKLLAALIMVFIPYILILTAFFLHWVSAYFLVVLLALPWSITLFSSMLQSRKDLFEKAEKKWWYLAQKSSTVFSILCILASIADMITKLMQL